MFGAALLERARAAFWILAGRTGMDGSSKSWEQLGSFLDSCGAAEVAAFLSPDQPEDTVRVLAIRHAFGYHNTFTVLGSIFNEDAELHTAGIAQAAHVGAYLRDKGVLASLDLVVVSPFTRALQTLRGLLSCEIPPVSQWHATPPVIVHPLCAEETQLISHVGRGNRGSTSKVLQQ
eukprot:4214815-Amphidinium_carterae.1